MAGLETLDEFAPRDTDPVSLGDDNIRETRAKTKTSVGAEHYLDGPHKIPGGVQSLRPAAGRAGRLYFNTDTKAAEYDTGGMWSSVADAKARACILHHGGVVTVLSGASQQEIPFDWIIDDPGGYASVGVHQIIQPENSIGLISVHVVISGSGGYGFYLNVEQWHPAHGWVYLVRAGTADQPYLSANTIVDSRWGTPLRVTVSNATGTTVTIAPTTVSASPRFAYAMFGRTA